MRAAVLSAVTFISVLWSIGGSLSFGVAAVEITIPGFLSNVPIYEFTLGAIIVVGFVYWVIAQRTAPHTAAAAAEARA